MNATSAADVLIGLGYAFLLPPIAVLHSRAATVRRSGALLATLAGSAFAAVGVAGGFNLDPRPAALALLGVWWWTAGKTWWETGILPRALGLATMAGAVLAFALLGADAVAAGRGAVAPIWEITHLALGAWLTALTIVFARQR
jgi:hypothetical protein